MPGSTISSGSQGALGHLASARWLSTMSTHLGGAAADALAGGATAARFPPRLATLTQTQGAAFHTRCLVPRLSGGRPAWWFCPHTAGLGPKTEPPRQSRSCVQSGATGQTFWRHQRQRQSQVPQMFPQPGSRDQCARRSSVSSAMYRAAALACACIASTHHQHKAVSLGALSGRLAPGYAESECQNLSLPRRSPDVSYTTAQVPA